VVSGTVAFMMDHTFDVKEHLEDSLMEKLCEKNLSETMEESALDQLCQSLLVDDNSVSGDDIILEDSPSLIDSAPPEVLEEIRREMDSENGSWHNQEYAMQEVERRILLKKELAQQLPVESSQ